MYAGVSMYLDYNLYQWYKKPTSISPEGRSSGQVLNILPIGGLGVWIGYPGGSTLGLEGGIDYMPFSFDTEDFQGMGAISFPVMLRFTQPFQPQKGISSFIGVGGGMQWSRTELYARTSAVKQILNPYFQTIVAELSLGIGAGWRADEKQTGLLAFYARVGGSFDKACTLNFGLRAKLIINPNAHKAELPKDPIYQRSYQACLTPAKYL
jgi:hypothetical protein